MSDRNFNQALLLVKVESPEGTDAGPTVAANPVAIVEPFSPDADYAFRNARPRVVRGNIIEAHRPLRPSGRFGTWNYAVHGRGSRGGGALGNPAVPANKIELEADLQAAGCSVVYSGGAGSEICVVRPAAVALPSVTKYYYQDGHLYKLLAAKNEISVEIDAGGPVVFNIAGTGLYQNIAETSVPAITGAEFGTAIPPICESVVVTLNFGSAFTTGIIRKFAMSFGNGTPQQRPSFGAAGTLAPHKIRWRTPTWRLTLEQPIASTAGANFESYEALGTPGSIGFTVAGAQYNRVGFAAPAAVITEPIKKTDDNGTIVIELAGTLHSSDGVALDAFEWKFS